MHRLNVDIAVRPATRCMICAAFPGTVCVDDATNTTRIR